MIGNIEAIGTVKSATNTVRNSVNPRSIKPGKAQRSVSAETDETEACEADNEGELRVRFVKALTVSLKADVSLSDVIKEMIEQGIERDEAIEWGIEAGLPESSVRTKVSTLYSEVDGGVRAKRKSDKRVKASTIERAGAMLKEFKGDYKAAKKEALAVYRALEKAEKEAAKASK